jgi:phage tail protein X
MIFSDSRYVSTKVIRESNSQTKIMTLRARYYFDMSKCTTYSVVQGDTLDGIADRVYGNSALGWAIMDANPNLTSELDIHAGLVLVLPDYEEAVNYCV